MDNAPGNDFWSFLLVNSNQAEGYSLTSLLSVCSYAGPLPSQNHCKTQRSRAPDARKCPVDMIGKMHSWTLNDMVAWTRLAQQQHHLTCFVPRGITTGSHTPLDEEQQGVNGSWEGKSVFSRNKLLYRLSSSKRSVLDTCSHKQCYIVSIGCIYI